MNFLVHLYLVDPAPLCRLGSLMGDFIKGPLRDDHPREVLTGLRHHRRLDSLAQSSPSTRRSRQRLSPQFGHARSILVDIFYDHILACCWQEFSSQPLEQFASDIYDLLEHHWHLLPAGLQEIAPRMIRHNWLFSYRQEESVERALTWLASRLSRPLPLAAGVDELRRYRQGLEDDFQAFIREAVTMGREEFAIESAGGPRSV